MPERSIRKAAEIWGNAKSSFIFHARGIEHHSNGVQNALGTINLALAGGRIGRPKSGYGTIVGQANGQGGREHGQKCDQLPGLRDIQRHNLRQRVDAVAEVIERSGRSVRTEVVSALICTIDGAVVSALVDDSQDPRTVARATVIDIIDAVAPFDRRPVQV